MHFCKHLGLNWLLFKRSCTFRKDATRVQAQCLFLIYPHCNLHIFLQFPCYLLNTKKKTPNPQPNHPKPKHPKHYNTRVKKPSYPIFQTQACLWIFLLQVNLCMFFSRVSRIKPKVCIAILFSMVCRKLYVRETFVYMQVPVWQRYMHITQL